MVLQTITELKTAVEFPEQSGHFSIEKLSPESVNLEKKMKRALEICDQHLGAGLYSLESINSIINAKHNYFFIINSGPDIIGIFCCYTTRFSAVVRELECKGKYLQDDEIAGVCRSIAVESEYRASGISDYLLKMACEILFKKENARIVVVPAWVRKDSGIVPARKHLMACGFLPAETIYHPWRKYGDVKCNACQKSPCECDCELYIKKR